MYTKPNLPPIRSGFGFVFFGFDNPSDRVESAAWFIIEVVAYLA